MKYSKNFLNIFNILKSVSTAMILILLMGMIFSCGGNNEAGNTPDNAQNYEDVNLPEDEIQNLEPERLLPDIPEADYGGHVYNILTFGVTGSDQWENVDLTSEEETGDVVGDAVYKRNTIIEEKYNITVKETHLYNDDFGTSLKNEINSGSNEYDLISPRLIDSANYMQSGYFMNLFNAPNIDLTKPWYDRQGIEEMSIDRKIFIVLSDILLSDDDSTAITIFNKQIIKDYGLEDPYALVKSGQWTVDRLYDMAKATARDIDGDGKLTPDIDQYGYLSMNDSMVTYLHAGDQRLISKDENDLPVLLFSEKTYEVMEKAMDLLYDDNVTGNVQKPMFANSPFEQIFTGDRAAFGWVRLYMIPRMRSMDTDFGILPIPKIYESIEGYPSTVNVHHACALSIPVTAVDIDRTTIIMEALAAESKYTLQPAYYEISLKTKHSRDDESSEMLDLILSNRVIDIGDVYNFADFGGDFYRLALTNNRNLASFYEKFQPRVEREIDKLIDKFADLD